MIYRVLKISNSVFRIEAEDLLTHDIHGLPDEFHTMKEAQDFCNELNRENQDKKILEI